jgi:hypothetical protein
MKKESVEGIEERGGGVERKKRKGEVGVEREKKKGELVIEMNSELEKEGGQKDSL